MHRFAALAAVAGAACSSPSTMEDAGASAWSRQAEMPGPRLEPGVTALGQRVVVLGGFYQGQADGLGITTDVIEYDMFAAPGHEWSSLRSAPVAWTHANLAAASATLYLLGGAEGTDFQERADAYALDTDQDNAQWRSLTPMPASMARSAAGIVVAPPFIYLIGGATATDALATVIAYNYSLDVWTRLPDLPAKRSHPAAMQMPDGTLIVAGGLESIYSRDAKSDVWSLAPGALEWKPRAPMLQARGGCAYGVVFEQLICAGGEIATQPDGDSTDIVERYDPVNDVWSRLDDMPEKRAGTQAAVVGGKLFVPGGARTLTYSPTNSLFAFAFLESLDR